MSHESEQYLTNPCLDHSTRLGGHLLYTHPLVLAVLLPSCKLLCDITLWLESSHTMAQAAWNGGELPLGFGVDVRSLVEGVEELVLLVGM